MSKVDLKIEIRPVPNRNDIRKFSKDLEHFSQAHTIGAFVDPVTYKYVTGLTDKDVEYLKAQGCPYDLSDNYVAGEPHPFWESQMAKISLTNSPQFLYPYRSILDFIKWKYLQKSAFIYQSEEQMLEGLKPTATHFIYDEREEVKIQASKIERIDAVKKKLSEMSLDRKRNILSIIENENTETKNDNYITVAFERLTKNKEKLVEIENLLLREDEDVSILADVKMAIFKDVLKKTKKGIFFFENNLGYSEEDVAEFLSDKENQEILITIQSKIK